ncbi:MAG: Trk family potassium uptake protein [Lachnospiraceae bacterium]|nr:Trk family potassium uptake protein [Lachnospiraceae bacterium]
MSGRFFGKQLSSFQIIIAGFLAVILGGTLLLALPFSSAAGCWTSLPDALFTAVSAVCVTGLVVRDTATYWSVFGQAVILILIQIGGLGIISITAVIANASGKRISLLQRSMLQESLSAHQMGGVLKLTGFLCKVALATELLGALLMLPAFSSAYGSSGIWMSVFHSVSAFCNAGFDIMGEKSGAFSSLTAFAGSPGIVIPICLLIISGGIGFLTWDDIAKNKFRLKRYRMQSKVILSATAFLILLPAAIFFFHDFSDLTLKERLCAAFFHSVTPRTAGFNTVELSSLSSAGRAMTVILMLIGGAPGSTAGGVKVTTLVVLLANMGAVVRRRKNPQLFGRRIEEDTVKCASTLLTLYLLLALGSAFIISVTEGLPFETCLFEAASAIGTVGLSYGITPALGLLSRGLLIGLMFFGRVGALTLLYAAVSNSKAIETAQYPVGRINVG